MLTWQEALRQTWADSENAVNAADPSVISGYFPISHNLAVYYLSCEVQKKKVKSSTHGFLLLNPRVIIERERERERENKNATTATSKA